MPVSINGNTGITFPDGSLQTAAASPFVLKNRIINGAMQVWQRGTSFTNNANGTYTVDRFSTTTSGINLTITQDTLVPSATFKYSLKAVPASNATASECGIRQFIEQQNITDFAGQTVTGSAWVYSSKSTVKFRLGTQNATGGTDVVQNVSVTAATWTRITFSFSSYAAVTAWTSTPNASGGFLDIGFADSTALTTSDYLYITGVQLEVGTSATPFERRLYNQELANCQRYYWKWVPSSSLSHLGIGISGTATTAYIVTGKLPVTMRVSPAIATPSSCRIYDGTSVVVTAIAGNFSSVDYFTCDMTTASGLTANRIAMFGANNTLSASVEFSSEL